MHMRMLIISEQPQGNDQLRLNSFIEINKYFKQESLKQRKQMNIQGFPKVMDTVSQKRNDSGIGARVLQLARVFKHARVL